MPLPLPGSPSLNETTFLKHKTMHQSMRITRKSRKMEIDRCGRKTYSMIFSPRNVNMFHHD
jgi:hypothetical protein